MRTTVSIDQSLLELAKSRAAQQGRTLGEFVEEALRVRLTQPASAKPVDLPVFEGGTGLRPGIDPTSNRDLFYAADSE